MKTKSLGMVVAFAAACIVAMAIAYPQVGAEKAKPEAPGEMKFSYKVFNVDEPRGAERTLNAYAAKGWRLVKTEVEAGSGLITVFMEKPE